MSNQEIITELKAMCDERFKLAQTAYDADDFSMNRYHQGVMAGLELAYQLLESEMDATAKKHGQKMCDVCRERFENPDKSTLVEAMGWDGTIHWGEAHTQCARVEKV